MSETADDLLASATEWVERHRDSCAARGVELGVERAPDGRDNPSLWIDFAGKDRLARLTLWASGEAVLAAVEVSSGSVLPEVQLEVADAGALEVVFGRAVAAVAGIR
ncbi:immunity protein TriTu family protein [Kribbella sp. GL6]|uniref:immunity protein TriTu family protein n=1 Tax=Kribbella sp. GL6 TaxID=3419765 RepID=UPI003D02D155